MAPDVVVVGGGIVGMASAYYLTRTGLKVVVFERSHPGSGSTDRALGGIRAQFTSPANIALSKHAMAVWDDFEATFGHDIEYRQHGYLFLTAVDATAQEFERAVDLQTQHGVPSEFLDPDEARRYLPELHADRYVAATYSPEDGTADPHLALEGFADAAREEGADIQTGAEVTAVVRDGADGRIAGVETRDQNVCCEYVVNAAGPWAGEVAEMAGVSLPLSPKRRQVAVVEPSRPYPEDAPLTADIDTGVHFAPERAGDALVGGHFAKTDPDWNPTTYPSDYEMDWVLEALDHAGHCAGHFGGDTRIKNGWSGLYTMTPDHHPIIEEHPPGFVNAVGFSGHGFMHAPATGQVVRDIVCEGGTSLTDLERFRLERFDEPGHATESAVL